MIEESNLAAFRASLRGKSDDTRRAYVAQARKWRGLSPEQISEWLTAQTPPTTPAGTVTVRWAAARAWVAFIGGDPSKLPKQPNARDRTLRDTLNREELDTYLSVVRSAEIPEAVRAILLILPRTMHRISEICKMRKEGYYVDSRGRHEILTIGKGGKVRKLTLTAELIALFEPWRETKGPYMFPSPQNPQRSISTATVRAHLARIRKNMSGAAQSVSPHVLRHTGATNMIRGGVPLTTVKDVLGHASVKTTERYLHTTADDRLRALEAAESQLGEEEG